MVGAASVFSWMLTVTGITRSLVEPLATAGLSPTATMALVNLTGLASGMFLDVFSNILILTPILMPLVAQAGVSGVHFGTITTVNVDIGNVTPPFGLNLSWRAELSTAPIFPWCVPFYLGSRLHW